MDPAPGNSVEKNSDSILTAEKLAEALPSMAMATKAIHADDFASSHRAIAPAMHVAVNYRYDRDPKKLIQGENGDVWAISFACVPGSDNFRPAKHPGRLVRLFPLFRAQQQTIRNGA